MSLDDESRYVYGSSFRFETGRLAPGMSFDGPCPWPAEYARRVFHGETDPAVEDGHMVALVGGTTTPTCAISISPDRGGFSAAFCDGLLGKGPKYSFYSPAVKYSEKFDELSESELLARGEQMFNTHVEFVEEVGGELMPVAVQLRPDGQIRLVIGPFGASEIRDWVACPGLDPETLWLPVPEFDDYRSLEVRERPILDVVRSIL